jgi:hypothetical protein
MFQSIRYTAIDFYDCDNAQLAHLHKLYNMIPDNNTVDDKEQFFLAIMP